MFTLFLFIVVIILLAHVKVRYIDQTLWFSLDFKRMINKIKEWTDKL